MELRSIHISHLALRRPVPRRCADDIVFERFIDEHGVPPVILGAIVADDLIDVIDGERRVFLARAIYDRGHLKEAHQQVPTLLIPAPSERERAIWRLILNRGNPLPTEEVEALTSKVEFGPQLQYALAPKQDKSNGAERINELLYSITARRSSVRSSRRVIDILEVARDHAAGVISPEDAMNRIRYSSAE